MKEKTNTGTIQESKKAKEKQETCYKINLFKP